MTNSNPTLPIKSKKTPGWLPFNDHLLMKTKVKLESWKLDIETHKNQFNNSDQGAKIYKNQSTSALLDFL